jgi:Fe-S cluster assembly iron-binding protein IscA
MITVTEAAREKLKETLQEHSDDNDISLRLTMNAGEFGLVLDKVSPGDDVVEHQGTKILILNHEVSELFQGAKLDVESTPDGEHLRLFPE